MTYSLQKWPPIKVLPDGTQIQLQVDEDGELRDPDEAPKDYFIFNFGVGRDNPNERNDVLRAQTLLGHAGYFDMERTEGPTGWYGKPLELGIRKFQKDNGLAVDGFMEPGGETLAALRQQFGGAFASHKPPSLKIIDEHHERRARGQPGLLETDRGKGRPFGVTLEATTNEVKPLPPRMRPAEVALRMSVGSAPRDGEVQIAAKPQEDPIRNPKPNAPGLPDIGGGGPLGVGKLLHDAAKGVEAGAVASQQQEAQKLKEFVSQSRTSLELGISEGFGKVERHESENTKESGRVLRDECIKAFGLRGLDGFKHIAGGFDRDTDEEKPEKAVKDGELERGGGGHSFPDFIFSDGKVFIVFNTATESGGKFVPREVRSFETLAKNVGQWAANIIGKKGKDESWDDYRKRAETVCHQGIDKMLEKERETPQQDDQQPTGSGDSPTAP